MSDIGLDDYLEGSSLPDIRVQVIFYIFTANMIFTMGCMLIAAAPYYHYVGQVVPTEHGVLGTFIAWIILLCALTVATYKEKIYAALTIFGLWWLTTALFVGFLSAFDYTIAPIQFMILSWCQSISVVIYTRISPRYISVNTAVGGMVVSTVAAWCISIYGFIVESAWVEAAVILVLAMLLVAYNTHQINATEQYDASWKQGVIAILRYYVSAPIKLFALISGTHK